MLSKKKNPPVPVLEEKSVSETETATELAALKAAVEALTPKPPATVFCDVEQKTYLALNVEGRPHLEQITFDGKPWGNACGGCLNQGEPGRPPGMAKLEDIADYMACRKLRFLKGTRLMGVGEVLLPYIEAKVPLHKVSSERLAHDFDRHPRFSNKPHRALVPGPKVQVDRYNSEGRRYQEKVELAKFVTEAGFDVDNPGRSHYRPMLPSERQEQLIEQLEASFAARVAQQESRKMHLDRRIVALEQARSELS